MLTWFGVELAGHGLPLDDARTCLTPGCLRHALSGELLCPVHLDIVLPEELPDHATEAATRGKRGLRALVLSVALSLVGMVVGAVVHETRFGWLGGIAAGAVIASFVAREARFPRFASLLGMLGFFAAVVLLFAGVIVGGISALPLVLP